MRTMFKLISECGLQLSDHLRKQTENGPIIIELKDMFTRFANDVIASTAFGIGVDSLKQRDNEFYKMAKMSTDFSGVRMLKFMGFISAPRIMKLLKIKLTPEEVESFFRRIVSEAIASRENGAFTRPDMIQLLFQARQGSLKHEASLEKDDNTGFATVEESHVGRHDHKTKLEQDDLAAQAMLFLFAGFDSMATLIAFTAYELATAPDVQKKLQDEIDKAKAIQEIPTYESLQKMKYMDMVVSEALRFWAPANAIDRVCVKKYVIEPLDEASGEKPITIMPGDNLFIPIYSIHHDGKYYPNPNKFDPERFSDENKHEIQSSAYIPFGVGPRNCIGSRFALMETKAVLFYILSQFTFNVCLQTQIPLKLSKSTILMLAEKGVWLQIIPRTTAK